MKRRALLVACAALCACQTPTTSPPADLVSPQALVRSGTQLFVASTNSDELRVLELAADPTARVFEPAPNPLYVLSVPVVTRPVALAADDDGHGNTGAYVLALSSVSGRLGVVVAADQKEEAEVALPGTPLAVAARTAGADGSAKVYVGVLLGDSHGAIAEVDLPAPGSLASSPPTAAIAFDLGTAAPRGLAVSPDGNTLAIADRLADERNPDPTQRRGGLILLDLPTGTTRRVLVGGPASRVVYSLDAQEQAGADPSCAIPGDAFPAGKFLYVLVESSNCPLGQRCGGIQRVVDGTVPEISPGVPAPPTRIPGTATDLAVAAASLDGGNLGLGGASCVPPLMVAAPSTNGFVYFLDGLRNRTFNIDAAGPDAGDVVHYDVDGGVLGTNDATGPQRFSIGVSLGGLESQAVVVVYGGLLPALSDRPAAVVSGADGGAQSTLVDLAADFPSLGVQPGDQVIFAGGGAGCPGTAVVASAQPGALALATAGAIDPSCYPVGGTGTYSVQVATPAAPYLVAGTVQGYLGRTADGAQSPDGGNLFVADVASYWRPDSADGGLPPALTFTMGAGDARPGAYWEFAVDPGITAVSAGGGNDAIQPGPVVWVPALKKFYVGYPGSQLGSHLAEIDPTLIVPGTSQNIGELQ